MPTIKKYEIAKWSVNEMIITGVTYTDGEVTGLTVRESANGGETKELVSVVHCRDCVHNDDDFCCAWGEYTHSKDDFCSRGKSNV